MKLEMNYKKKTVKITRLNNMLQTNQQVSEEIKR